MTNPEPGEQNRRFIQLWIEGFSLVLGQIMGKTFSFEAVEDGSGAPGATDEDVYLIVNAAGTVRGEMSLRVPKESAVILAKTFVGEAATDTELTDDDRAALEELLRQVGGHVSTAAKPIWQELPFNLSLAQAPTWPAAASGWLRSSAGATAEVAIAWQFSAALSASLAAVEAKPSPSTGEKNTPPTDPGRLGFLMDLELDVTLRFGGRNILLKDILQLGPGSVLELDREIHDAADLLLDGKLIARGEVVMVDGNYGLRVKEVFSGSQLTM